MGFNVPHRTIVCTRIFRNWVKQLRVSESKWRNSSNDVGADRERSNTDPDKERRDATARFIESARWSSRPIYGAYQQFCNVPLSTVGLVVTGSPYERTQVCVRRAKEFGN